MRWYGVVSQYDTLRYVYSNVAAVGKLFNEMIILCVVSNQKDMVAFQCFEYLECFTGNTS